MTRAGRPGHSALYEGWVSHVRTGPPTHRFRYRVALCYLDLDELAAVLAQHPLWSTDRGRPVQVRRDDYLGDPSVPLAEAVRTLVAPELPPPDDAERGPVRLLAHPRTWGWCFNPLALAFCFDRPDGVPHTVVASVTNTPWGERHDYVLRAEVDGVVDRTVAKALHVSPFLGMDQTHRFTVDPPGDRLRVAVENREAGRRVLRAELRLERRPLDRPAMTRLLLRHPLMTWRVSAGIYAQAARLWAKGAPVHRHPGRGRVVEGMGR